MTDTASQPDRKTFVLRLIAMVVGLFALITVLGLLITKVLDDVAPIANEDSLNRALADDRTASGEQVTGWFSGLASTPVIIGMLIVVMVIFRVIYKRWRESLFMLLAVGTQTLIFVTTALVVARDRPDKALQLDSAPPTSSFPSGHTGAATALFVAVALVVGWRTRRTWVRPLLIGLAIALPLAVAYSRLYRGMHHPSDVVASFVNGLLAVAIYARTVLFGVIPTQWARALDGKAGAGSSANSDMREGVVS